MQSKKDEHDELKKLSEKDLWCRDLDAFVHEWEVQLKEEAEYAKAARSSNRRASRKIGAGKTAGKSKAKAAGNEYNPKPAKASKPIAKVVEKVKGPRFDPQFFGAPKSKKSSMGSDGVDEEKHEISSDDDFEALKPTKVTERTKDKESSTSRGASEQPAPANGRTKRAAAAAPKKWVVDDDEESESDMSFGNIGDMVKGIGEGGAEKAKDARLSLFAMSRPDSSHGGGRAPSNDVPKLKAKPSKVFTFDDSEEDQTNYEMLAKSSPVKTAPAARDHLDSFLSSDNEDAVVTKKVVARPAAKRPVISDDDDESVLVPKKVVKKPAAPVAAKPVPKAVVQGSMISDSDDDDVLVPKKAPAPKKAAAPKAAPKAKVQELSSDNDDEAMVQELISSDEDEDLKPMTKKAPAKAVKPAPKPSSKKAPAPEKAAEPVKAKPAAALSPAAKAYAKKQGNLAASKKADFSEDEDDLDVDMDKESEEDSPAPVARGATGRGRPARAAAAAKPKKPIYVDSEEDEMDIEDNDESAIVEDEESEDFDESE